MPELSQEMTADQLQFRAGLVSGGGFFYPHTLTWSDGVARQFVVIDPSAGKKAGNIVLTPDRAALRTIEFHPDSEAPAIGSTVAWESGTLHLGFPTDVDDLSGQALYACCQVDARYFPQPIVLADGTQWLGRIEALSARPGQIESGNDLVSIPGNSHRLSLPPGALLNPGDEVKTSNGDRYTVVPPVQRGVLGDVLGLSWQGPPQVGVDPTPDPVPVPGDPVVTPAGPSDAWWHETHTL